MCVRVTQRNSLRFVTREFEDYSLARTTLLKIVTFWLLNLWSSGVKQTVDLVV